MVKLNLKNSLHEFNSCSEVWDKFQLYELCGSIDN